MSEALCLECRTLAQDLHDLLQSIDPSRFRRDVEDRARLQLRRIRLKSQEILRSYEVPEGDRSLVRLYDGVQRTAALLDELRPSAAEWADRKRAEWDQLRERLHPVYSVMAACLERMAVPMPHLRPTNYARSAFHVTCAMGVLALIQFGLSAEQLPWVAVPVALGAWTLEALRTRWDVVTRLCMVFLGRVAHPHEWHKVNSSTWYCSALALLSLFSTPLASSVGVVVLGVADPAAALIGRRYGRRRIRNSRTLEGSLGFVVVGTLAAVAMLAAFYPGAGWGVALPCALVASMAGALAELYSGPLDDNLTIPVAAALGAGLFLHIFA